MNLHRSSQITMISTTLTLTIIWLSPYAAARGAMTHTDVASTRHIQELPPEIRNALRSWQSACGAPLRAKSLFAHYLGDPAVRYRLISLHFHELGCADRGSLCTNQGCLHEVYISTGSTYHLAFSAHVPDVALRFVDHTPTIEIDCETYSFQDCARVLRWDGRRFAGQ